MGVVAREALLRKILIGLLSDSINEIVDVLYEEK